MSKVASCCRLSIMRVSTPSPQRRAMKDQPSPITAGDLPLLPRDQVIAEFNKAFASLKAKDQDLAQQIAQATTGLQRAAKKAAEAFTPMLQMVGDVATQVAVVGSVLRASLARLPNEVRTAVDTLGAAGWYVDTQMPYRLVPKLAEMVAAKQIDQVDRFMLGYIAERLDKIEERVIAAAPHREAVIRQALAAHRRGDYYLSVVTLLTQIDGIFTDATGHEFFTGKKRPRTAQLLDEVATTEIWKSMLLPLGSKHAINLSEGERPAGSTLLNRHMVLHGESTDFGTELNSAKCVSLLNYSAWVAEVVPDLKKEAAEAAASTPP